MILNREIEPGQRLTELSLTELLAASRTPVRYALQMLSQEGLIEPVGQRGYQVRIFRSDDSERAIDVRSVLEGLAARQVCEAGAAPELLLQLRGIVAEGDTILADAEFGPQHVAAFSDMNGRFHEMIVEAAANEPLKLALRRNDRLPFASSRSVAFNEANRSSEVMRLRVAHWQHHQLVAAFTKGESARAEALMREHALLAKTSLSAFDTDEAPHKLRTRRGRRE